MVTDKEAVTASIKFAGNILHYVPSPHVPSPSHVPSPLHVPSPPREPSPPHVPSLPSSDDHRMLVSPACGAALAAVYGGVISDLQKAHKLPMTLSNVVVVVCGGNEVSLDLIQSWKETYGITA